MRFVPYWHQNVVYLPQPPQRAEERAAERREEL